MAFIQQARRVVRGAYGLTPPLRVRPLHRGRVNLSFVVDAAQGRFVLQRLNPLLARDGAVTENLARVGHCLLRQGVPAPWLVHANDGQPWVEADGHWRLLSWVEGRPLKAPSPEAAARALGFLGRFHRALAQCELELLPGPLGEHALQEPFGPEKWQGLAEDFAGDPKLAEVRDDLERGAELAAGLPGLEDGTQAVLHGDPKLDNFLFDDQGEVTALVDLDTVKRGPVILDVADALRSWAGRRDQDDRVELDQETFWAGAAGYAAAGLEPDGGWQGLPDAVAGVALNLAWRYLRDYFQESYFAWDQARYPSLARQNLARGRGMLQLAGQVLARRDELLEGLAGRGLR